MADPKSNSTGEKTERKRRAPQGPRKPQPLYVFGTVEDGKFVVSKVTKNARDIAKWVADGGLASGVQLVTIEQTPDDAGKPASSEVGTGDTPEPVKVTA